MNDLDQMTEVLNSLLAQAEAQFRLMHMGVSGEVQMGDRTLAFTKVGADWILEVRHGADSCPLHKARRLDRILAAAMLQPLSDRIQENVGALANEIAAAQGLVREFLGLDENNRALPHKSVDLTRKDT